MFVSKREIIYTSEKEINDSNIVEVLRKAKEKHNLNVANMQKLYNFEDGDQPILRVKEYRPSINCHCIDNIAHEITKFHVGYEWGNPITLIQRGEKDSGSIDEPQAIALLNEQYEVEGIKTKTQQLGKDVTITNLGYTHVDINTEYEEGDSYFKLTCLSPLTTFIVRSKYYIDHRPIMAVTYSVDDNNIIHYTCYTKDARYEISEDEIIFSEQNPLGKIPIVEWIGNYDGMGIWEHEISEMENLNLMISDFSNTVEQNMQAVWHTNDVEFPKKEIEKEDGTKEVETIKPKNGDWLNTFTTQDGKTPFIKPLTLDYDYANMLGNIASRRALILQKCYVPTRNDDSGGSTGLAMNTATGWSSLDIVAESIQAIQESCKMEEIKLVLAAIKKSEYVPADSPLLKLSAKDIKPNVKRQKLSEMVSKVNALATLIKNGVYGAHAIRSINYFDDPNQVWEDSKQLIEKYQKSLFDGNNATDTDIDDRLQQDTSDQATNSPFVDGITTKDSKVGVE